jgi:hypothetical protein
MQDMTTSTSRQDDQQKTLLEAHSAPGVREVLEVYRTIAPYAGTRIVAPAASAVYATNGNA